MKARMKVFLVALLVVLFIPLLSSHSQGDPEEPTDNSSNLLEDLISGAANLVVFLFKDRTLSPRVRVDGIWVNKCGESDAFPCTLGNRLLVGETFCTSEISVMLYDGLHQKTYFSKEVCAYLRMNVDQSSKNCTTTDDGRGNQWFAPSVSVLLFLMVCAIVVTVIVPLAVWLRSRSKFVNNCCILLQKEGYVCQNPSFTLGRWVTNCLWPTKNLEFASDDVTPGQTRIRVVYKATAGTIKNRPDLPNPGLLICKRCEPSVSNELQKAGISVFCCCDCPDWKTCFLEAFKEFKNSRGSDARIVTCINLHVRLGQAIQDKDTAFQERDQALKDKDTAFQERDQALKDKENAFQERDQALKDKDTACRELDQALKDKDNMNRGFTEQIRELEKKLASKDELRLPIPVSDDGLQPYTSQGNFDGTSTSPPIRVSDENVGSNASYPIEEDIPVSMQITGQDDKCMLYFCVIVVVKYCPSYSIQE